MRCSRVEYRNNTEVVLDFQTAVIIMKDNVVPETIPKLKLYMESVVESINAWQALEVTQGKSHNQQDWSVDKSTGRTIKVEM